MRIQNKKQAAPFNAMRHLSIFSVHTGKVTSIGVAANAVFNVYAAKDPEVMRHEMSSFFGNGKEVAYNPLIAYTIDGDNYISFKPTRDQVKYYFERHIRKFNWEAMSDEDVKLAYFEYFNSFNGDAQLVIDDNKKLTNWKSNARVHSIDLVALKKMSLSLNIGGETLQEDLDAHNKGIKSWDSPKQFVGGQAFVVKGNLSEESYMSSNNKDMMVVEGFQRARVRVVKYLGETINDLVEYRDGVEYNGTDKKAINDLASGIDKNTGIGASMRTMASIFGGNYQIDLGHESLTKDLFKIESGDFTMDNFAETEMNAELSDSRKKWIADLQNFTFNAFKDEDNSALAAHMMLASKRGKLNNDTSSTFYTTAFGHHAFLLLKHFSNDDGNAINVARFAGSPLQVLYNEKFEEDQSVELINGSQLKGFKSTLKELIKEEEGLKYNYSVKYFDGKPYVVYDVFEMIEQKIEQQKQECAQNPKAILHVQFDGIRGTYDKGKAEIVYPDNAKEIIDRVNAALSSGNKLAVSFNHETNALFSIKEDGTSEFVADLFSAGKACYHLQDYLDKAIIEKSEVMLGLKGILGYDQQKEAVGMSLSVTLTGEKYDGELKKSTSSEFEVELEEEVVNVILSNKKKTSSFSGYFGKPKFIIEDQDGESSEIEVENESDTDQASASPDTEVDSEEEVIEEIVEEDDYGYGDDDEDIDPDLAD